MRFSLSSHSGRLIDLVVFRGCTKYQELDWWRHLDYRVIDTAWKTTELTRADREAFAFYFDDQSTLKHNETFITFLVGMRRHGISPGFCYLAVIHLQHLRSKANFIWRGVPREERAVRR